MESAPMPSNESERLKSLREHQILDTLPEQVYDDITNIATQICGTPIALITLIDKDRQWIKSKQGIDVSETPRDTAFCSHAILNPDEPFIIPDARYDERFHDNPFTTGDTGVVFYAGVPVKDENGLALGSLCVIDHRPRELSEQNIEALKALSKLVNAHFALRKAQIKNKKLLENIDSARHQAQIIEQEVNKLEAQNPSEKNNLLAIKNASVNIQKIESETN